MSPLSTDPQTAAASLAPEAEDPVADAEAKPLSGITAPGWFQKRRLRSQPTDAATTESTAGSRASSRGRPAMPVLQDTTEQELDERDWKQRTIDWLRGVAAESYGASLIVHAVLLFCMSLYIFQLQDANDAVALTASDANSLPTEFEEIVALQLDSAGNSDETALPQNQTLPFQTDPLLASDAAVDFAKYAGSGEGQQGDDATGLLFQMPSGGKVVSAGSFTAWTVPKDPAPGEDYKIVIMIRVPEKHRRYRISDLSGSVTGTDGFTLEVPFGKFRNRYGTRIQRSTELVFPGRRDSARVVDGKVQVVVDIPGAARLVEDTIELKSRMLKEEQTLKIEF
ncbi:MAG: hypothetical protein ACYTGL_02115 [Planctomycetota bacterium]|jgi:hypothetical protein